MADPSDIKLPDPSPPKNRAEQLAPQRIDPVEPDSGPQPLAPNEQAEMSQLLGKAERTPEEHGRLEELHSMASDYVNSWKADPQAAAGHMIDLFSMVAAALGHLSAITPAFGGIASIVHRISDRVNSLKDAVTPPPPPPELPPAPEDTSMTQEEKIAADGDAEGTPPDDNDRPEPDAPAADVPRGDAMGSLAPASARQSPSQAAAAARAKP